MPPHPPSNVEVHDLHYALMLVLAIMMVMVLISLTRVLIRGVVVVAMVMSRSDITGMLLVCVLDYWSGVYSCS